MRFNDMTDEELIFLKIQFAECSRTVISSGKYCLRQIDIHTSLQSEIEYVLRERRADV